MSDTEPEPRHGERGWELLTYSWDEDSGLGTFLYQRPTRDFRVTRHMETREVHRQHMVPAPRPKKAQLAYDEAQS